ncbi:MAG: acetyl-CoA decarbonylase/synthase complex subunit delta [Candidatus Hydrogenedentes bacterium]|nr:acetyl-CoA decarbonylase/synthase complex subunit delta [Candidatus Hydrogenedentota bacterium]
MKAQDTATKWAAAINEVRIGATPADGGTRRNTVTIGGAQCVPWLAYEGKTGNRPAIAVEIWDRGGETWPGALLEQYGDCVKDPAAWAKKAAEFGADLICLKLMGAHPAMGGISAREAADTVKSVLAAVDLPLIVWGCDVNERDNEVLPKCSEAAKGENCLFGTIKEKNYRTLVASCLADGHKLLAESPLDINIAKQLNVLAHDVGYPLEQLVIFPTTAALGYGFEYVYSIMERSRLAGLGGDPLLRQPTLCDVGLQAWRAKEAITAEDALPGFGPVGARGPLWEAITATNYLQAGADLLVMRHPGSIRLVKESIDRLCSVPAA